jgi:ribosomal protein L12E/L44/L45/RPP1/RPP2
MNRDREALECLVMAIDGSNIGDYTSALTDARARLALPVGGGAELQDAICGLCNRRRQAIEAENSSVVLYLDELELILAALSPRSADGLLEARGKDGAAAPPQAPVAGSEDSAEKGASQ